MLCFLELSREIYVIVQAQQEPALKYYKDVILIYVVSMEVSQY